MMKVQKTAIVHVDKIRRLCLWRKDDISEHPSSLAAWHMVCRPKGKGGPGVISLEFQNEALLLKHLFYFFNHADIPWVNMAWQAHYVSEIPQALGRVRSFWWRDVCSLMENFRAVAKCVPGDGSSILGWKDGWMDILLADKMPRLFSFALNPDILLKEMLAADMFEELAHLFDIPVPLKAFVELQELFNLLIDLRTDNQLGGSLRCLVVP
ncbi:hypothetical protein ACQJBY_041320 [Aegilops geniculata]